jgi:large subunit ribosomal protein L25
MAERQQRTVEAQLRLGRGKNDARRARSQGLVPLTIYGGDGGTVAATAPLAELASILRSETGHNTIFTINVEGSGVSEVMFYDRQIDPVRGRLVHADLKRLVFGEKIEVTVQIHLVGEALGVRENAGFLEQQLRAIEIKCDPREIPDSIDVDVTNLGVHDVLHVSDLKVAEGIEILHDPDAVVATCSVLREEVVATPTEVEEPAEPEVIGKGKKEEEAK